MKKISEIKDLIQSFGQAHHGVFCLSDIKALLQKTDKPSWDYWLARLTKNKILLRFSRGIYVTKDFDLEVVCQKLCPNSYISFGNVLAKNLLIGSIPQKTVSAVKLGVSRIYKSSHGTLVYTGINPNMFFGYQKNNGINYAVKEKAFLDTLYFYQLGKKFSFNIYADIHIEDLDIKKIKTYLKKYKNQKFVQFVKGVLNA